MTKKVATLTTKAELKREKDKITILQAFYSSYFCGKSQFEDDATHSYSFFQPMYRYFKQTGNADHISAWKSKILSHESIKPPAISDNSFVSSLDYFRVRTRIKFDGQCLKQDQVSFTRKKIVNI